MINLVLKLQNQKKYIFQATIFFILFLVTYFVLDYLNMSYKDMIKNFGLYLVIINIFLNIVMALLGAFMMNLGTGLAELTSKKENVSNLGVISIIFGILTYGCTSCIITFLASIGIPFLVIALPLAGLPYKVVALLILIIGVIWLMRRIKNSHCKI